METKQAPDAFTEQVRDALQHLFDISALQAHPLLDQFVAPVVVDSPARAQALRDAILKAIADLRPPSGAAVSNPVSRPYAILRHRFAEGQSTDEVLRLLAISRRQFFREQQRAVEAVASLLWQRRLGPISPGADSDREFDDELEYLGVQSRSFILNDVVAEALDAVRGLAESSRVTLRLQPGDAVPAYADEAIARQLLVSLLRAVVQGCAAQCLAVQVGSEGRWANVILGLASLCQEMADADGLLSVPARLAERVGGSIEVVGGPGGPGTVCLSLPSARERVIVVVDDNPKTLRLFERYLESYPYRVVPVQDSTVALAQIRSLRPDGVILDVMMRDVDGWKILQTLKTDPETRDMPVFVCSVLDERDLARSIGADGYLRKPVNQQALLEALAQVQLGAGAEPG